MKCSLVKQKLCLVSNTPNTRCFETTGNLVGPTINVKIGYIDMNYMLLQIIQFGKFILILMQMAFSQAKLGIYIYIPEILHYFSCRFFFARKGGL